MSCEIEKNASEEWECFSMQRADQNLFAVYQTMYSDADYKMWYDWEQRLQDTKWTEECFFVYKDGKKIGGIIATEYILAYAFLITPFDDREAFWKFMLSKYAAEQIFGIAHDDVIILEKMGYEIASQNKVMCRPSDDIAGEIPEGFVMKPLDIAQQEEELGKVMEESFEGSVAGRILEKPTAETAITNVKTILHSFGKGDRSQVIVEEESGKIVAICVAGKDEKYPLHYTEIAELCVLPAYRERGLASFMIRSIATNAALEASPFVKAVLFEGDDIELLFRENGFFCGPAFVHMEKTE